MADGLHVLAIDIGSSSVRAGIFDQRFRAISRNRCMRDDAMSGITFNADRLWTQVATCVGALTDNLRANVECVSVTAHVGSVFLDENREVVGLARGWADTSGLDKLTNVLGGDVPRYLGITGRPALIGGPVAALLALRIGDPAEFARVASVLSPKDFINARLTGVVCTDMVSAAYFGALDVLQRDWSAEILRELGLDAAVMPQVMPSVSKVGNLCPEAAKALGVTAGIPVACGGPDGTVGASFVLAGRSDCLADIAGTTDVLVKLTDQVPEKRGDVMINPFVDSTSWWVGGPTGSTGGAVCQWAHMLGYEQASGTAFEAEIRSVAPGCDGLRVKPFLTGSRFPRWRHDERGSVSGQAETHQRRHFLRAVCEGAAFIAREGVDRLAEDDRTVGVVLAGGAAKSDTLARMRADIFGRLVMVVEEADVSLVGAARLAWLVLGVDPAVSASLPQARLIKPDPHHARLYDEIYRDWLGT